MIFNGQGNLISQRESISEKTGKVYNYVKVIDETGGELEMRTDSKILGFKRFSLCSFEVDITQGKFPGYALKNIEMLEN